MLLRRVLPIVTVVPALLLAGGCSPKDEEMWDEGDPARIVTFRTSAATVRPGDPATLVWVTKQVSSLQIIDRDGASVELGDAPTESGKVVVQPGENAYFTLHATSAKTGDVLKRRLEIKRPGAPVTPPVTPPTTSGGARIDSFTAFPGTIMPRGLAVLEWSTKSTRIRIDSDWGEYLFDDTTMQVGSLLVDPTWNTRYILTAFDAHGDSVSAEVEVKVNGAPVPYIRTFSVWPDHFDGSLVDRAFVRLDWDVSGARSLTLEASEGGPYELSGKLTDSIEVTVGPTTTFRLIATNEAGTNEKTVTVTREDAP